MYYRRSAAMGGTFFFTVNLANRSSRLLTRYIHVLRDTMCRVQRAHPFKIVAMVVLPDHMHAVWTLPSSDSDFPLRWSLIKSGFSRSLEKTEYIDETRRRKRERGIWQRRYWEHQIRNNDDLTRHVDYIHINPVKHGHAGAPIDWPYSSIHRYIRQGLLPVDWGVDRGIPGSGYGE